MSVSIKAKVVEDTIFIVRAELNMSELKHLRNALAEACGSLNTELWDQLETICDDGENL